MQKNIKAYQAISELSSELVLFLDTNLSLQWSNKAFSDFEKDNHINQLDQFIPYRLLKQAVDNLNNNDETYTFEFRFAQSSFKAKFSCLNNDNNKPNFVIVCNNYDDTVHNLTYIDPVTHTGNRAFNIKKIDEFYEQLVLNPDLHMLVLTIDFNNFGRVDYFYGYKAGDKALKDFAQQLQAFDSSNMVARISGSNLTVMRIFEKNFAIDDYMKQVVAIFDQPIQINDNESISVSTNIGAVILPKDAHNKSDVIKHLDLAYEQATKRYENVSVVFYQDSFGKDNIKRLEIERNLETAIKNDELELYYQPKVDIKTKQIYAFEALLRWHNSEIGFISPLDFIPVAEDSGQIVQLGLWVIEQVCLQCNKWQARGYNFGVSLNISIRQLQDPLCVKSFKEIIHNTGVDTSLLEFEITESILSESLAEITDLFTQIKELGVSISLDDFGTKYSSLSYLTSLPIDILKIDRSFIKDSCESIKDGAIANVIVSLAKELGLKVVAEGVENYDQVSLLEHMDCDYIQGFYYYKPMTVEQVEKLLDEQIGAS